MWYSGKLWRIIAVYPDGTMKLVTENAMTTINWGTNVYFNNSYVDQWLSQEFLPTLYNYQNIIVQDAEWNVTMTEVTTDPYLETESTTINRTLGLLNAYEYKRAGENSSYLFTAQNFFLMNPANSSDERFVNNNGIRNAPITALFKAYSIYGIRPSIYLSSNVVFTNMNESDAGKRSNPYRVSGDKATGLSGELINDRLSGEYVKLTDSSNNELLYRIIGIENEKTKIVSTTYVTNTSTSSVSGHFGADANFKTPANNSETWDNQYWDNYLKDPTSNGWLSTLSSDTLSILDTGTYYLGYHTIGSDLTKSSYKSTICASGYDNNTSINNCTKISNNSLIYTGKVGLLRLGEMMAAQQLTTMHSNYYAIYKDMWLITPEYYDTTRYITYLNQVDGQNGINCYKASDCSRSVRPTLHLKPQVTITGGSGTVYDPYTLTLSNS